MENKPIIGYTTSFDFSRDEVRKGWWKFSKKFGNPLDMRTHYQVKIPASQNDRNVDITLFSVSKAINLKTQFFLGVADSSFQSQVASMLHNFKKSFYIDYYVGKMEEKEDVASKLSERYLLEPENRVEILNELQVQQNQMEQLKREILKIEQK